MSTTISSKNVSWARSMYSARRTTHRVNFFCHAPEAKQVSIIGDFNQWQPEASIMSQQQDGNWMISLELTHGHHQYLFLVDGKPMLDSAALGKARNERNEPVSLIAVS